MLRLANFFNGFLLAIYFNRLLSLANCGSIQGQRPVKAAHVDDCINKVVQFLRLL